PRPAPAPRAMPAEPPDAPLPPAAPRAFAAEPAWPDAPPMPPSAPWPAPAPMAFQLDQDRLLDLQDKLQDKMFDLQDKLDFKFEFDLQDKLALANDKVMDLQRMKFPMAYAPQMMPMKGRLSNMSD